MMLGWERFSRMVCATLGVIKTRRTLAFAFLLLAIPGFLVGATVSYISWGLKPAGGGKTIEFAIPEGATTSWVAAKLYQNKIIRNPTLFRFYARSHDLDKRIATGTYKVSSELSVPEILRRLTSGEQVTKRFTIPEGLTVKEIAARLERQNIASGQAFLHELQNGEFGYTFLPRDLVGPARFEGYLFPDTYQVFPDVSVHAVIEGMLRRFATVSQELNLAAEAAKQGLTAHQAVTLASLVEREAKRSEERALIAGVLYNRLRKGMPLQVDATVQYALGEHRERILYEDLTVDSPYNTYRVTGLPPGPIAAPGRASLLAVIRPAETDYLYYVAKPDGSHAFSRTLAEHNANKGRYQSNPE